MNPYSSGKGMFTSCLEKQQRIISLFSTYTTPEERYQKIIQLGKQQPPLPSVLKIPENLVNGCQSRMYLHAREEEGKIYFASESDALISSGLAALLILVYSGESAETILRCPPTYLITLGMDTSLSPSRANGLHSIHLRMKQEALKTLMKS
jgi:cysteine desulfuration protein SufE